MNYKDAVKSARNRHLVDDNKFERHFRNALKRDLASKKEIFTNQTAHRDERDETVRALGGGDANSRR